MGPSRFDLRVRPEKAAGGFARDNGAVAFYQRIDALIGPDMTVLDLGAGRGAVLETAPPYVAGLLRLKGRVARVIGVDVDPIVLGNPLLDEAHVVAPGARLPLGDASIDLVYADWVLEHVEEPRRFCAEVDRILRPGGWFCARTPHRWSYIAAAARLLPGRVQDRLLRVAQPDRREADVFPKFYRLNTPAAVRSLFPEAAYLNATYAHNPEPGYHGGRIALYKLIEFIQATPLPPTTLHVFVMKR